MKFALSRDDFGAPFALGFRLAGHGPLHLLRQVDVLDFDRLHFDTPLVGFRIENFLQLGVERVATGQEFIEFGLPEHIAQHRLGFLVGGIVKVLDIDHGFTWAENSEKHHRIDVHGHIIFGDDVLRGDIHRHQARVDAKHALDDGNHNDNPRPTHSLKFTEPQDDATLPFA